MNEERRRADHVGSHRTVYEKNKKIVLQTQEICGICGRPVDKSLIPPHPLAPTVDHIIPLDRGGHPSDLSNLQLAHWTCNRQKSNKLIKEQLVGGLKNTISNRNLPLTRDWSAYEEA